jgi:hypothetical protein
MNRIPNLILITCCILLLLLLSPRTSIQGGQSEWSSAITGDTYYSWYALKSELRNLKTNEQYHDKYLIGGINVPGGRNGIFLNSSPTAEFDFFNGSRLVHVVGVEGDIGIELPKFASDFHLAILPIKSNNKSFFELLFEEKDLLENLTHSVYLTSSITDTVAKASLKYQDVLDVQYEWNTSTGLLMRKEVTAPSGLQLIVVPGRGNPTPGWNISIVLITILVSVGWQTKRKHAK